MFTLLSLLNYYMQTSIYKIINKSKNKVFFLHGISCIVGRALISSSKINSLPLSNFSQHMLYGKAYPSIYSHSETDIEECILAD